MDSDTPNKVIVGRWFDAYWGGAHDPGIVDELAAPDMVLQYAMGEARRGRR